MLFGTHSHGCRLEWSRSTSHFLGTRVWLSHALCIQSSTHTWSRCPHSTSPEGGRQFRTPAHWGLGIQSLWNKTKGPSVNMLLSGSVRQGRNIFATHACISELEILWVLVSRSNYYDISGLLLGMDSSPQDSGIPTCCLSPGCYSVCNSLLAFANYSQGKHIEHQLLKKKSTVLRGYNLSISYTYIRTTTQLLK